MSIISDILQAMSGATPLYGADPSIALSAGLLPVTSPVLDPGADILTVGVGKQFATLHDAVAASHDGTVILVDAGTYVNDFAISTHKISIIGTGGRATFIATAEPPNGKAILTVDNDILVRNITFTMAAVPESLGGNAAGIRYEGGVMVLENDSFISNQNGILGAAVIPGLSVNTITIDHCFFDMNGSGSGFTHNVYIGTGVSQLTFTNNISQNVSVGHLLKSRAAANDIENNVFADGPNGTGSYAIDLPNGGIDVVANNIIEKGPQAQNNAMVHFGGEGIPYAGSSLLVVNNSFINDKGDGVVGVLNQTTINVSITGNTFSSPDLTKVAAGPAALSQNADGNGVLLPNATLTGAIPGNTLIITDALDHTVVLDGAPWLAVMGGGGLLTVTAQTGHVTASGGAGGMVYGEAPQSGGNTILTASGSVNTLNINGVGGDTVGSAGKDTILTGAGNVNAQIDGAAVISDGTGNNQYLVHGDATITGHGGNPVVSVGAKGNAVISGQVGYLHVQTSGGTAAINVMQGGAQEAVSILAGAVDVVIDAALIQIHTSGGPSGAKIVLGAGAAQVVSTGADTIQAGSGPAIISVAGAASIQAGSGALTVFGHGNSLGANVFANGGTITLDGDTGNLHYFGGGSANTVFSILSNDTLTGGTGRMTVIGGSRETIIGGAGGIDFSSPDGGGDNVITTAAGSVNHLTLSAANTIISNGTDAIEGGIGNSTFTLNGAATLNGSTGNSHITVNGTAHVIGHGVDFVTVNAGATAEITTGLMSKIEASGASVSLSAGTAHVTVNNGEASMTGTAGAITLFLNGTGAKTTARLDGNAVTAQISGTGVTFDIGAGGSRTIKGFRIGTDIVHIVDGLSVTSSSILDASTVLGFSDGGTLTLTGVTTSLIPAVTAHLNNDTGLSAVDRVTADAALAGSGDPNAVVTVAEGGTVIGTTMADATGAWHFTPTPLSQGAHTISVSETGVSGITVTAALAFTFDTVSASFLAAPDLAAASDSGVSNTDNITSVTTPAFNGTAEAGSTVALYDGTVKLGSAVAAGGTWTITSPALANGKHTLTAMATDAAGNAGAASAGLTVTIDTVAPNQPMALDLATASDSGSSNQDNITNVTTPVLSGLAEAGGTVRLSDQTGVLGTTTAAANGVWTVSISTPLANGSHGFFATASDAAGNVSRVSTTLMVTIDTAANAPSAPRLTAASDSGASSTDAITNVVRPVFTGTGTEASSKVSLFDTDGVTLLGTGLTDRSGNWSVTSTTLSAGLHTITAKQTDMAGNTSAASLAVDVMIDTAAPVSPSFTTLAASGSGGVSLGGVSLGGVSLGGAAEAGATVSIFDLSTRLGGIVSNGGWSFLTGNSTTDTVHIYTATATSIAGNISPILGSAQLGSSAADTLNSTAGNDLMTGGMGADTFAFLADFANDTITDFSGTDIVNFHQNAVLADWTSVQAHMVQTGANVLISQNSNNTLTLLNTQKSALTESNFTFV